MSMMSRSLSSSASRRPTTTGMPNFSATAPPRAASMSQSAATSYISGSAW